MFTHFGQRLKRDLKQMVDRRIEASESSSGSLMRVSTVFIVCDQRLVLRLSLVHGR